MVTSESPVAAETLIGRRRIDICVGVIPAHEKECTHMEVMELGKEAYEAFKENCGRRRGGSVVCVPMVRDG